MEFYGLIHNTCECWLNIAVWTNQRGFESCKGRGKSFPLNENFGEIPHFLNLDGFLDFLSKKQHMNEDYWESRRLQYRNLAKLCADVDAAISSIVMLSFLNNLFFICVQLLRSLKCVTVQNQSFCQSTRCFILLLSIHISGPCRWQY